MSQPCDHAYEIANQLALHDFPGMPDITELKPDVREPYLVLAVEMLDATKTGQPRCERCGRGPS